MCCIGPYKFRVDLTEMTAAASVELWVGTDADPLSISKVLELLYDDMVRGQQLVNEQLCCRNKGSILALASPIWWAMHLVGWHKRIGVKFGALGRGVDWEQYERGIRC